jgi:hypothetical protein
MKSFSLIILGLFCFLSVSAQEKKIPEDQFIPQLQTKQKELYDLIDVKDSLSREVEILITLINASKEDAEKLKNEQSKDTLQKKVDSLTSEITAKCKNYKKHHESLSAYQGVSKEFLAKYKVRICQVYTAEVKEEERDPEKFIIVGDNEPIKKEELLSTENARKVFTDVFSIDSKTNLGTFEVPGDKSFVNFFIRARDIDDLAKIEGYNKKYADSIRKKYRGKSYAISIKQYNKLKQNVPKNDGGDDIFNHKNNQLQHLKAEELVDAFVPNSTSGEFFTGIKVGGALFKSIQIELREGGIVDTRLILHSTDGQYEFYFEGTSPVSILNYSRKARKRSFLKYSHYADLKGNGKIDKINEDALKLLQVNYIDVLDYHPNAGSNYVPDDVSYKFPSDKKEEAKIAGKRRSYQVINNNHLQNVLDLRAYTDLLGLFADESNGLFQIEGKAEFFIHPFNFSRTALYLFKKVSPYVRYSRFDDETGFVQATPSPQDMPTEFLLSDAKLSLLERSNLEMGLDINLINFRWFKESPFWTSIYFPLSYNVTKVRTDATMEDNDANYKTLGFGFGLDFEIRRFNNFGLNVGYELKGHSFIGDYTDFSITEPGYLKTQAVKAEIFYYPGDDRSNSIFVRMKSVRDIGSGVGDTFFQLQFGYRFTLGVGAIRAK